MSNRLIIGNWFCRWPAVVPLAVKLVTEQGRMKFVRPIYRDLYAWTDMRKVHSSVIQREVVLEIW